MKKLIFLITLVFISNILFAQTKQERDSLNNVLATSTQDTTKVMALCRLSFSEPDIARKFSLVNKAITLARKIQFEKGEVVCYYTLGDAFFNISDYPQSLEYMLKALKLSEKLAYTPGIVRSLGGVGLVYSTLQNDEAALGYFFKESEVLMQNTIPNQSVSWAMLYTRISRIYL